MKKKKNKIRKRKTLGQIFVRTLVVTSIVLIVLVSIGAILYNRIFEPGTGGILNTKPDPVNKTLAVFGVDEKGTRTDVVFVVNYNSESGESKIISVPRDTKIDWTEAQQEKMKALKGYSVSTSKITEMTGYVGIDNITEFTVASLEDLLGIQIDNYMIITLDTFREIVDAIGGVEVDVPVLNGNGLHYDDSAQGLSIHLEPGLQVLNGEQAEGLVRFRKGYVDADVGRIKTQQLFLEAFAKKISSPSIITKIPSILKTVSKNMQTDIQLTEMMGYLPYLKTLNTSAFNFNIIPGEPRYIGGKSYFIPDEAAMPTFIHEIFSSKEQQSELDYNVTIEILNSTAIKGAASSAKQLLESEGYTVASIGNYTDSILDETVIYAKEVSKAYQFLAYYIDAEIVQNEAISEDIQIVLGNDIQN